MLTPPYLEYSKDRGSKSLAQAYPKLLLETALGALIHPVAEALNQGNIALAIDYLQASRGRMEQENEDGFYNDRISKHKRQIGELMQQNPHL